MFTYFTNEERNAEGAGVYFYLLYLFFDYKSEWIEISVKESTKILNIPKRNFIHRILRMKKIGLLEVVRNKDDIDFMDVKLVFNPFKTFYNKEVVSEYLHNEVLAVELKGEYLNQYQIIKNAKERRGEMTTA